MIDGAIINVPRGVVAVTHGYGYDHHVEPKKTTRVKGRIKLGVSNVHPRWSN